MIRVHKYPYGVEAKNFFVESSLTLKRQIFTVIYQVLDGKLREVTSISLGALFQIKNLLIANLFKPFIGCDLLLSETMFSKTDTLTTRRGKRELCISYTKMNRPFICSAMSLNKEAIGISVWTEDITAYK